MKPLSRLGSFLGVAATLALALTQASSAQNSSDALLQRLIDESGKVHSYTADVHADIAMRTFPYLSPSLDGTYYHKEPDKDKIVFTSGLPTIAKQFSKVYPQIPPPIHWKATFVVSTEGESDGVMTFKLVPRKHGRVDHIDARVDEKTATVVGMRWNYNDGGYANLDLGYTTIEGAPVYSQQSGHVEVPNYTVDVKSTFTNVKLHANIPDSVFTQN